MELLRRSSFRCIKISCVVTLYVLLKNSNRLQIHLLHFKKKTITTTVTASKIQDKNFSSNRSLPFVTYDEIFVAVTHRYTYSNPQISRPPANRMGEMGRAREFFKRLSKVTIGTCTEWRSCCLRRAFGSPPMSTFNSRNN